MLIIAGGSGEANCTVAQAMSNLAQEVGVPPSSIRVETASRSTRENAELTGPLLEAWDVRRIVVVTDQLHMPRAAGAFSQLGFEVERASVPIYQGHHDNIAMLRAGVREYAALAYYQLRGWLQPKSDQSNEVRDLLAKKEARVFRNSEGPIVLLGASYAQGWNPGSIGHVPVINRGIAGQQSFELLARFDHDVAAAKPRAVILWGFINDLFRAPANDIEPVLERIRASYLELITRARAAGIEPVIATEVTARPRSDSMAASFANLIGALARKSSYQDQINQQVLAMNNWLMDLAAREQIPVLHFQSMLADESGRRRKLFAQPDGSHITPAGYDRLTAYARPILEELIGAQ